MKINLLSFFAGLPFAIGLGVGGMTQTQKVQGFLDIFGNWDPSLLFVMVGAVSVHFLVVRLFRNRPSPIFESKWHLPTRTRITPALIFGALLFGMGWALAGYCPGPAVVSIMGFQLKPMIFVLSMFGGMIFFRLIDRKLKIET